LREFEWRSENLPELIFLTPDVLSAQRFPGEFVQLWLGIKQIHMARPAPHEEKNDAFGARTKVRPARRKG
jgi:hypothetical protein